MKITKGMRFTMTGTERMGRTYRVRSIRRELGTMVVTADVFLSDGSMIRTPERFSLDTLPGAIKEVL